MWNFFDSNYAMLLWPVIIFTFFIGYIVYRTWGTHPELFDMFEGEEIVEIVSADYLKKSFIANDRIIGELAFTNKRVMFKGLKVKSTFDGVVSIPYSDMISVENASLVHFYRSALKLPLLRMSLINFI